MLRLEENQPSKGCRLAFDHAFEPHLISTTWRDQTRKLIYTLYPDFTP